jgi:hypothetical protein
MSPTGLSPAPAVRSSTLRLSDSDPVMMDPTTPAGRAGRFRLVPVRSPLLRESRLLSLPPGTEMFQFPGLYRVSRDRRAFGRSPALLAAFHARFCARRLGIPPVPLGAWPRRPDTETASTAAPVRFSTDPRFCPLGCSSRPGPDPGSLSGHRSPEPERVFRDHAEKTLQTRLVEPAFQASSTIKLCLDVSLVVTVKRNASDHPDQTRSGLPR